MLPDLPLGCLRQFLFMVQVLSALCTAAGRGMSISEDAMMHWNNEQIPVKVALRIGWNLPMDVVGAGVYGGIVKRDAHGKVIVGDEWPEDNVAPPAHNPVHSTGPCLDYSKFSSSN